MIPPHNKPYKTRNLLIAFLDITNHVIKKESTLPIHFKMILQTPTVPENPTTERTYITSNIRNFLTVKKTCYRCNPLVTPAITENHTNHMTIYPHLLSPKNLSSVC